MSKLDLTNREREVLLLAAEGLTDKEIAERLGITRGTISTHWTRMRERTGTINRAQVMARSMSHIVRESEAELARTASLYQSLVETLEDFAVFLLDHQRHNISWNPGVQKIIGYEEAEWTSLFGDVIFTPEDIAAKVPENEQGTAERDGRALDDRWHVRKDGSRFWASGVMVPIRDHNGETVCYSKVLRDLTRLKRLEERLTEMGVDVRTIQ
ncbi:PAS domain S-box protein [bacterium]|nr:MAG: PAS domain S-box protein [bacterium]